ncbi:AfsR/SARP family transcriptional regulator [Demequina sp.]|uniref:AfsR/SARP family transcriptional regulator n=1 Tax=Demequina sp. TaxID=2050685 RepID=UPI003D0BF6C4
METTQLTLRLLGAPTLLSGDSPVALSPGASLLCAYLALAPKEGRARDIAAAHLFSDCSAPTARRRLNTAVWRLRTEVRARTGVEIVAEATGRRVALSSAIEVALDARLFEQLTTPTLETRAHDLTPAQASALEAAVSMHRGTLVEPCDHEWVLSERARIENLYLTALDHLLQYYGARKELGAIAKYGDMALAMEPLREDVHRHVMAAYGAAGRDDLVERQFERCRTVLLEELGADPMPETIALYATLRRREPSAPGEGNPSVGALVAELERAHREITRLSEIVDRALDHVARLR